MKVLVAPTEDFIKRERTALSADAAAGSNVTLTLENNDGILNNTYIVIGKEGSEQAELQLVNQAPSGSTDARVATLKFAHKKGEPVTVYRYNKRKFYGSLTAGGSYTELVADGSPITIGVDDPQGSVLEYTGGEGYLYFKATYYNSTTAVESNIADALEVLGDETGRYCSIYAIKHQAGLAENPYITDGIVETYRKRAENEVNSYIYNRYVLPLENSEGNLEIPFVIENATTLLAAGYMDYKEFGKDGEGVKWLGEARGILKGLRDGTQRLIGLDGVEFATKSVAHTVQSYPDTVDNDEGPFQSFTRGQTF